MQNVAKGGVRWLLRWRRDRLSLLSNCYHQLLLLPIILTIIIIITIIIVLYARYAYNDAFWSILVMCWLCVVVICGIERWIEGKIWHAMRYITHSLRRRFTLSDSSHTPLCAVWKLISLPLSFPPSLFFYVFFPRLRVVLDFVYGFIFTLLY